ncbi:MAG: SDR family oxidoreductase [Candidatus Marinimicrobia bacterium]|nr:SDR family oxidoreductase [Candidatus Neomarinimicrobiota bacterium]MCF7880620.1 SDR family oxidoreductase [Candidatus Neomarinimicrobiota bacterium]
MNYIADKFNLDKKVAIITGGSGVLGTAMAGGLLNAGARVVILGRDEEKLQRKVVSLSEIGGRVIGRKCDVLKKDEIRQVNYEVLDKFGQIDILINAAGGNMSGATIDDEHTVFDMDIRDFNEVTDLNLNGTVLPTLIFGKSMADRKSGSIINLSSMASFRAITRVVGYSAAKAGVDNFTRWMAVEMARKFGEGIRVNAIAPGFLLTEQNRNLLTDTDGSLSERGQSIIDVTPFGRFGDPEELIGAILWLAGDASGFVTGAVIPIDGGFSIFNGV